MLSMTEMLQVHIKGQSPSGNNLLRSRWPVSSVPSFTLLPPSSRTVLLGTRLYSYCLNIRCLLYSNLQQELEDGSCLLMRGMGFHADGGQNIVWDLLPHSLSLSLLLWQLQSLPTALLFLCITLHYTDMHELLFFHLLTYVIIICKQIQLLFNISVFILLSRGVSDIWGLVRAGHFVSILISANANVGQLVKF